MGPWDVMERGCSVRHRDRDQRNEQSERSADRAANETMKQAFDEKQLDDETVEGAEAFHRADFSEAFGDGHQHRVELEVSMLRRCRSHWSSSEADMWFSVASRRVGTH